jgi:hypothetical protein
VSMTVIYTCKYINMYVIFKFFGIKPLAYNGLQLPEGRDLYH